jgi:hypothetical protein
MALNSTTQRLYAMSDCHFGDDSIMASKKLHIVFAAICPGFLFGLAHTALGQPEVMGWEI